MIIAVVGIGLDGQDGLTKNVQEIVQQATFLAGSKRQLSYFRDHPAEKLNLTNLTTGIEAIAEANLANHTVVILVSGDPLFFGLGRLLLEYFKPSQLKFYPHLSSLQLAFSRLKIPWQDAQLISVHGRNTEQLVRQLKQGQEKIAVLTDNHNHPGEIARLYLSLDLSVKYGFYICENLGDVTEKTSYFSPEEIKQLSNLDSDCFTSLNILVLIREAKPDNLRLADLPLIGLPDSSFLSFRDRPSLITKKEIRLAILGELALQAKQTIWDIGAGTGSVSIEIARLCPSSQIYAVEKTSMGSSLINKNSQRFKVDNLNVVNGKAPEALLDLPNPNRIFIGGSGGNIIDILNLCSQKLSAQGIIVMSFATIEYQYQAIDWLKSNAWHYRILQFQISRSIPIHHLTRFTPLNPVTIITAFDA